MKFLGSCEVCGKVVHNYRGLAGHLRHNQDAAHAALRTAWLEWRSAHPRKADRWGAPIPQRLRWTPGDALYQRVTEALLQGTVVVRIMRSQGISYKVFRAMAEHFLGCEGYKAWSHARKYATATANIGLWHEAYANLPPEAKASRLKRLFGGTCALESLLAEQLQARGVRDLVLNDWQTVCVDGKDTPREADIKVPLKDGRKLVVLCDGEAFHGPRSIFNPDNRVRDDVSTARAYFGLGYSVIRYSESEIKSGAAIEHLQGVMHKLKTSGRVYRTWFPPEEVWV